MSKIQIGVAILGFGTVGRGVFDLLADADSIQARHGVTFDVRKILVRDPSAAKVSAIPAHLLTTEIDDILVDPSVDVVVEVIGGTSTAKDYIVKALDAGKAVVTANKALMGSKGDVLFARARQNSQYLGFQAAITGCHQFGRAMLSSVGVKSLAGVFNGTSNYILTRMEDGGLSQDEALKEAQSQGFAEADPSNDIDGRDTCNKLVLISMLAFGMFLDVDQIPVKGIREVTKRDMDFAKELGYSIKLVGVSKITDDGKIEARVHPCLVPLGHQLAAVKGVDNGIEVYDTLSDVFGMKAPGAGGQPTAMAIFRDLLSVAHQEAIIWPKTFHAKPKYVNTRLGFGDYYLRLNVNDTPGVLAIVAKALGRHKINIKQVIQPSGTSGQTALVILCGTSQERHIEQAVEEIAELDVVVSKPVVIRVEDDFHGRNALASAA